MRSELTPEERAQMDPHKDYMCDTCGKVKFGPHEGERYKGDVPITNMQRYKGVPISHGKCQRCADKFVREYAAQKRMKAGPTQANRDRVKAERAAARNFRKEAAKEKREIKRVTDDMTAAERAKAGYKRRGTRSARDVRGKK